MIDAVLAPGPGDQVRPVASGSAQFLAVSQALPAARRFERGPATVVGIIALMRALGEVRHAAWGDQQFINAAGRRSASFGKSVLILIPVHLAPVTVDHVVHDGALHREQQHCRGPTQQGWSGRTSGHAARRATGHACTGVGLHRCSATPEELERSTLFTDPGGDASSRLALQSCVEIPHCSR